MVVMVKLRIPAADGTFERTEIDSTPRQIHKVCFDGNVHIEAEQV